MGLMNGRLMILLEDVVGSRDAFAAAGMYVRYLPGARTQELPVGANREFDSERIVCGLHP